MIAKFIEQQNRLNLSAYQPIKLTLILKKIE